MRLHLLRTAAFFSVVALWLGSAAGALAQGSGSAAALSPAHDLAARQHFARGRTAYEQGNFAVALDAFQAAYSITQHPKLLYNVGLASQKLGLVTEAITAFDGYLTWGEGDREEEVRGRLAALRDLANRDAAFVGAEPARAPPPAEVAQAAFPPLEPARSPPARAQRESPPRRWWPWVVAGGLVTALVVATAVPLARRDSDRPEPITPNTGLTVEALWRAR